MGNYKCNSSQILVMVTCANLICRFASDLTACSLLPCTNFCWFFILLFINQKWFYFFFFTNPIILLNVMCRHLFFPYLFFTSLLLFKSIIRSHKCNMINCFRITIIEMIIVKINISKVYTIKGYIVSKECNKISVYITKDYVVVRKYSIIKFFSYFTRKATVMSKVVQCLSFL